MGAEVKILIVDDHEMIRTGIRSILRSRGEFQVCGEASDGEEAIEKARELKPDLVILDINMPMLDGFGAAKVIKQDIPEVQILFFSMHTGRNLVEQAKLAGAQGFVAKDQAGSLLLTAVETMSRNLTFFPT